MKREWIILPSALLTALLLSGCGKKERAPVSESSPAVAAVPAAAPAEAEKPDRAPAAAAEPIPRLVPFKTFSGGTADRDVFMQSTAPVSYGIPGSSVVVIQTAPPAVPEPEPPAPEPDKVKPAPRPIY